MMKKPRHLHAVSALLLAATPATAATLKPLFHFADTGTTQSQYANGAGPTGELLQASDGNFYGTTIYGGAGLCPKQGTSGVQGCGTIFRLTPQGAITTLFSFPYDTATSTAPKGAYPTAGLIEGKDHNLYGVAQDGGTARCNGVLGCGTLFRITTAGAFTLLHQFCSGDGCANPSEGGRPYAHLVQLPSGALCGTTQQGGTGNNGTLFCATTKGAVTTEYVFNPSNGTDGDTPSAALLPDKNGTTLYGTTAFGGANGGGTVFAYTLGATTLTILHAFGGNTGDMTTTPYSALIFGANGKLYGTTYSGNPAAGIFSLNTDGTGYASLNVFNPEVAGAGFESTSGPLLATNGLMYGTTEAGGTGGDNGSLYSYNPAKNTAKFIGAYTGTTGAAPRAVPIEGMDGYLYTTTTLYGGSNKRGTDAGTIVRALPSLTK